MEYSFNLDSETRVSGKARVPHYLAETRYLQQRPRGIGKGAFSQQYSAYSLSRDDPLIYRKQKKQVQPTPHLDKPNKRKIKQSEPLRNPILQEEESYGNYNYQTRKIGQSAPSFATVYSNQRKYCLPSQLGITKPSVPLLHFNPDFLQSKRRVQTRESEAGELLQYKYALPYKDFKLTEKPNK